MNEYVEKFDKTAADQNPFGVVFPAESLAILAQLGTSLEDLFRLLEALGYEEKYEKEETGSDDDHVDAFIYGDELVTK